MCPALRRKRFKFPALKNAIYISFIYVSLFKKKEKMNTVLHKDEFLLKLHMKMINKM